MSSSDVNIFMASGIVAAVSPISFQTIKKGTFEGMQIARFFLDVVIGVRQRDGKIKYPLHPFRFQYSNVPIESRDSTKNQIGNAQQLREAIKVGMFVIIQGRMNSWLFKQDDGPERLNVGLKINMNGIKYGGNVGVPSSEQQAPPPPPKPEAPPPQTYDDNDDLPF